MAAASAANTADTSSNDTAQAAAYPNRSIVHRVATNGYESYGEEVWIADPAKTKVVSWSGNISAYYKISAKRLASFATMRGIVW